MSTNTTTSQPTTAQPVREDESESARLCNKWVNNALTKNTSIQYMVNHLIEIGCQPPDSFIRCMSCKEPAAGGFGMVEETVLKPSTTTTTTTIPKEQCHRNMQDLQAQLQREKEGSSRLSIQPEIYICQQYMEDELMTHKTIAHELIHALDACRTKMDPLRNCVHLACTEIRAENLSGECSFLRELPRMERYAGHGQACVRRRAILSVRANPKCAAHAEQYVDAAMERCFQDVYPFDRHPNLR